MKVVPRRALGPLQMARNNAPLQRRGETFKRLRTGSTSLTRMLRAASFDGLMGFSRASFKDWSNGWTTFSASTFNARLCNHARSRRGPSLGGDDDATAAHRHRGARGPRVPRRYTRAKLRSNRYASSRSSMASPRHRRPSARLRRLYDRRRVWLSRSTPRRGRQLSKSWNARPTRRAPALAPGGTLPCDRRPHAVRTQTRSRHARAGYVMNERIAVALIAAHRAFAEALETGLAAPEEEEPIEAHQAVPALLRKDELATQLRVSPATIDRYVVAGMPYRPFGSAKRFSLADCLAWTASRPRKPKLPAPIFDSVRLLKRK